MKQFIKRAQSLAFAAAMVLSAGMSAMPHASAAAANTGLTATPKVTFTFDDGVTSDITNAVPALAASGFTGTAYIITGCVDMTTTPNGCKADGTRTYMTWDQIKQLHDQYGWNIGSHTVDHPYMASTGGGEQVMLTTEQIRAELADSKAALAAHGYDAVDFAAPYGDYNNTVLAEAAKYYATFRGFADIGSNVWPYNDRLVVNEQVQDTAGETTAQTVARIKTYIDAAATNNQWLTLTFHNITAGASSGVPGNYEFPASGLAEIAAYVKTKGIAVATPHDAVANGVTNMLANGSFDSAISTDYVNRNNLPNSWVTDDTTGTLVHTDANSNGSYVLGNNTSLNNALYIAANGADAHIWAPKVTVDPNTTYVVKGYFNIMTILSGEVAFYIDEYDASGAVISTQYSSAVRYDANVNAIRVKDANFAYKPSSANVVAARIYINVQGNAGITGYIDNIEMFNPTGTTTPPVAKTGDVTGEGVVNDDDATIMFANWGKQSTGTTYDAGDIDHNHVINDDDATLLFANWSK